MAASVPTAGEQFSNQPKLRLRVAPYNRVRHVGQEGSVKLPHRRQFLHLAAGAAAFVILFSTGAWSQATRTIKIVVPIAPGGSMDILARVLGEQIGRTQGPTMLIENRTGAGGVIAAEAVSRAAPDGNTLLIDSSNLIITPQLRKLSYDPLTSFEPICYLTSTPSVIIVNNASPYLTLADLLDVARAKPGELTLAATGPLTTFHLGFETLKLAAKVDMTFVPYPGGAPVANSLLGGHVTSSMITYPAVAEQIKAGKLRALATLSRSRLELLPDVPTVAESGYSNYEVNSWFGMVAPAKTPEATVSQLADWLTAAMQVPEVKAKLVAQGLFPVGVCGTDFGAFMRKQYGEYGQIIREAKIKAQ
jgi:tripartite-type tricarboxylate transporter receptor subunit TctC